MKKRILSMLLVVIMILSMAPTTLAASSVFTDVKADDWFADEVKYVYDNGLMQGVGNNKFDPNGMTTRAMIVTILWRLENEPAVNYAMNFEDVVANTWYTEAVRWAASEKIVEGYGNGKFGTDDAITREQMVTILYRYAQYKGYDVSVGENTNILSYGDAFDVAEWAIPAMQWACGSGIIQGIADGNILNLQPQGTATRAQVAAIFYRFLEEVISIAPETHTVTFMWNYGDKGVYAKVEVEDGQSVGTLTNPTRSGYDFAGWYTVDGVRFALNTKVTEDVVVYAKWNEDVYIPPIVIPPVHTHSYGDWVANGDCTHSQKCSCGAANTADCDEYSICSVCGFNRLEYVLEHGGSIILREDATADEYVASAGVEVTIELDSKKLDGAVTNNGDLTINGEGTMESDTAGLVDKGTATLKDITMKAGSPADYAVISGGGNTTLENVDIESAGGGVGATDGAKLVFDGGSVAVNSESTSGRYVFYAAGEGTEITIKSGDFSFSKTLNQKRAYIYAGVGATVYVEGGNFGPASKRDGYTAGIMGEGTVIITGGTFGFDPTEWVAEGYYAAKEGDVWIVKQCEGHAFTTEVGYHTCDNCSFTEMCTPKVVDGDAVVCVVCGKDYVVAAEATLDLENVTIQNDGVGVESYGSVNLKNITMNAGSTEDYAVIIRGGTATLENVALDSAGGGIGAVNGAKLVFDGGIVAVNTESTSGRYNFYAVGDGTEITIKSGDFSFSATLNQKRAYIYAGSGATVKVEGGNFGPASKRDGYTDGIMGDGTVIITGGTFGFDPTNWVAPGYAAVKSEDTWTVSPISFKATRPTAQIVNDPEIPDVAQIGETGFDTLADALTAATDGDTVKLLSDISFDTDDAYKANGSHLTMLYVNGKNVTLDMNGKTISVDYQSTTAMLISVIHVTDGAGLTVTGNGTIDVAKAPVVGDSTEIAYMFRKQGTTGYLVIENGYYHMVNAEDSMIYTNGNEIVTVNGGTFVLDEVGTGSSGNNGCPWMFNCAGSNERHVLVNGGSFNADITDTAFQYWDKEVQIADGMIVQQKSDGMYHVIRPNMSITRGEETVYFDTMTDAITAAQDGDTIVLAQDVAVDETVAADLGIAKLNSDIPTDQHVTLFNVAGKSITVDLNGQQIYADVTGLPEGFALAGIFSTSNGGHLTLKDSTNTGVVEVNAVNDENSADYVNVFAMIINLDDSSSIVIESGTYILDRSVSAMIDTRSNEGVIVNGGTFMLDNVFDPGLKNGQAWTFNAKGQNTRHVIVTGGTFPADIQHQYYPFEVSMAKELALQYNQATGMYTVVPAVAYVNEQEFSGRWYTNDVGYATMEEAYAAVEPPKTSWDGQVSEQEYVTSLIADYYGSLSDAFSGDNVLTDSTGASVSVAEEDGKKVVTLLDDVALTETLNIEEAATLDLNGYEITSESEVAIRTTADVVIDGTKEGSAITVNAPAGQKGTVLSAMTGELTVNGGTYTSNTSGAGTKTSQTQVIYVYDNTTANVNDATIVATDSNNGCVIGVNGAKATSVLNLTNCDIIVSSGKSLENLGVQAKGDAVLSGCSVIAEADYVANAAGNNYASNSRGILSEATLELYDCYVWGTHSGVTAKGSVYVEGGTYEGYGHGSFYLAGSNTTSYFYNCELNWAPMREGTVADVVAGTNGAGFYIGNGADNVVAYFDNCDFNMNEGNGELYKGNPVPFYGIVLRTAGGESDNKVYLSNCYVEMANYQMFRGNGTSGHTVYNGVGNDWSKAAVEHKGSAASYIDTNESYAK